MRGRRGWGWLLLGTLLAGAVTGVALSPAGAAGEPVVVSMGVTGATSSNCGGLATGGSDVYVAPDTELRFTTTVVGVNALGLQLGGLPLSGVANLGGALTVDGRAYRVDATRSVAVPPLSPGDHRYLLSFDTVTVAGLLPVPISQLGGTIAAGVTLTYAGVIHVTTAAAKCGVSAQLPGAVVSASLPGLPPVVVSVPPVSLPTVGVTLPNLVGAGTPAPATSRATAVPAGRATIKASAQNAAAPAGATARQAPGLAGPPAAAGSTAAAEAGTQPSPVSIIRRTRASEPTALQRPTTWLALLAVLQLAIVTSAYARRYLAPPA